MTAARVRKVDQTGLKTGMALTIVLLIVAFVLNSPLLVAFVAVAQLLGALALPFAPYRLAYEYAVKPSGIVKPQPVTDNPEPHRFAMLVGALFNGAAVVALLAGAPTVAWVLVGIVVVLANLNFWLNFCMGCWMYYQFNRLGIPGFTVAPVQRQKVIMLERLLIVIVLAVVALVVYRLVTRRHLKRVSPAQRDSLLDGLREGIPSVVYFTTPQCMPCKTQQLPAIKMLEAELGDCVQIIRVDATEQPEAAERWGVFSVPTTFVLDEQGRAREVNYGVADTAKLRRQLLAASQPL